MRHRLLRPAVLIPTFVLLSLGAGIGYAAYEQIGTSAAEENARLLDSLPVFPGASETARRAQAYSGEGTLPLPQGVVTTVVYVPPPDAAQEDIVRFYVSRLDSWEVSTRSAPAQEGGGESVYRVDFTRGDECVALMTYGMAPSQDPATRSFGLAASTEEGGCG